MGLTNGIREYRTGGSRGFGYARSHHSRRVALRKTIVTAITTTLMVDIFADGPLLHRELVVL